MNLFNKIKKRGLFLTIIYCLITIIYKFIKFFYIKFLNRSKVEDNIFIFSSRPDFSDNSKYMYLYILNNSNKANNKYIWLVNFDCDLKECGENTKFIKLNSKFHKGQSLKALYYISKAKTIFFTHTSPMTEMKKKANQTIINLWHGCGYKSVEKGKKSWIDYNPFDYALVPGPVFIKTKKEFWGCSEEQIIPIGYPRYDLLCNDNTDVEKFKEKLCANNKLIIWMPTFRKTTNGNYPEEKVNMDYDLPLLSSDKEVEKLNDICKCKNIILCIKRHPMQIEYTCEKMNLSNIIFIDNEYLVSNNIELYSLLKYSDSLITDYSSIAIDYLLLDKPIGFTLDDFDKYKETRGFVFENPLDYMPGYHIYNFSDLIKYIKSVSEKQDLYKEDRKKVINEVHNKCDNYCERIYKFVRKIEGDKNE